MAITIKQLNITLHVSEGNGQESAVNEVENDAPGTSTPSNSCQDQSAKGRSALVASTAKEVLRVLKEQQER